MFLIQETNVLYNKTFGRPLNKILGVSLAGFCQIYSAVSVPFPCRAVHTTLHQNVCVFVFPFPCKDTMHILIFQIFKAIFRNLDRISPFYAKNLSFCLDIPMIMFTFAGKSINRSWN